MRLQGQASHNRTKALTPWERKDHARLRTMRLSVEALQVAMMSASPTEQGRIRNRIRTIRVLIESLGRF